MSKAHFLEFKTQILKWPQMQMHYIEVPSEIVEKLGKKFNIRLLCSVNNTIKYHCGLMSMGSGTGCISINKKRLSILNLKEGDEVIVTLEKDNSKYGVEMPAELTELLYQDEEGNSRFHALTPGKQRNIIYYVLSVKSPQLRIERAIKIIENLKALPKGKETVKRIFGLEKRGL